MSWARSGTVPEKIKVSFEIRRDQNPELAAWYWGLPFRQGSEILRNILDTAVKQVGAGATSAEADPARPPFHLESPVVPAADVKRKTIGSPTAAQLTGAVAAAIADYDKTF